MAHNVHIRRVETHAALLPNSSLTGEEVARLVNRTLKEELDKLFGILSISTDVIVCIRRLTVTLGYQPDLASSDVRREWVKQLTTVLHQLLTQADPDVVVFRTTRNLLLDMAVGIARADFRRKWAWLQSNVVRRGASDESISLEDSLIDSIIAEATNGGSLGDGGIVAFLAELANQGTLNPLWSRLSGAHHRRLLDDVLLKAKPVSSTPADGSLNVQQHAAARKWAQRLDWSRSHIFRSLAFAAVASPADTRYTLLLLALLELEPLALHRGPHAVELALSYAMETLSPKDSSQQQSELTVSPTDPSSETAAELPKRAAIPSRLGPSTFLTDDGSPAPERSHTQRTAELLPFPHSKRRDVNQPTSTDGASLAVVHNLNSNNQTRSDVDGPGLGISVLPTEFAGLLFFVHGFAALNTVDSFLHDETFCGRSIRTWLILLARVLVPNLPRGDAAELAFAGLAPNANWPSHLDLELSVAERQKLLTLADQLTTWLQQRLGPVSLSAETTTPVSDSILSPRAAIDFVVCRRARIVAEPGWIDVILEQQQVRTEIRRAGLDIDPGYLPWLGCVVRFIYE